MDYETISSMLVTTEQAINTLRDFQEPQIKNKSEDILGQICDYIYKILNDANWIFDGVKYFDSIYLAPDGVLHVGNSATALPMMKPIVKFYKSGIKIFGTLSNDEMLTLVHAWSYFKEEFHKSIAKSFEKKQKELNKQVQEMSYVQNELNKFKI